MVTFKLQKVPSGQEGEWMGRSEEGEAEAVVLEGQDGGWLGQ